MADILGGMLLIGLWLSLCSAIIMGSPWYPPSWLDPWVEAGLPVGLLLISTAVVAYGFLLL